MRSSETSSHLKSEVAGAQPLTVGRFQEVTAPERSGQVLARISFDLLVAVPGVGIFLWGWKLAAASELVSVLLTAPGIGKVDLLELDYEPVKRSDVAQAFRGPDAQELTPAEENCGFAAFIPQTEDEPFSELLVQCRTSDGTRATFHLAEIPSDDAVAGAFLKQAARFVFERVDEVRLERLGRRWYPLVANLVESWQSATEMQLAVDHCSVLGGHWLLLMASRPSPQLLASAKRFVVSSRSGRFAALHWRVTGDWFVGVAEGIVAQGGEELFLLPVSDKGLRRPFRVQVDRSLGIPLVEARRIVEWLCPSESEDDPVRNPQLEIADSGADVCCQVDGLIGRTLHGWAAARDDERAVEVEVLVDGAKVAKVLANRRERTFGVGVNRRDHAFEALLPVSALDGGPHQVRVVAVGTDSVIAEFATGAGHYDARLDDFRGGVVYGWVLQRTIDFEPATISVVVDDEALGEFSCEVRLEEQLAIELGHACGFEVPLPARFLDGRPHSFKASVGKERVLRSEIRAEVRGAVDRVNEQVLTGWAAEFAPSGIRPVALDLLLEGQTLDTASARIFRPDVGAHCGFQYDLSRFTGELHSFELCLKLKGTEIAVAQTPLYFVRKDDEVRLLQRVLTELRAKTTLDRDGRWLRGLLPVLVRESRERAADHRLLSDPEPQIASNTARVSVVIPVYGGFEETRACIQSVLDARSQNRTEHDLVIVDDCGPDARLSTALRAFAQKPGVVLLRNERNVGFVKSVNRALGHCNGRDVLVLNADTVVTGDWLDRLRAAAHSRAEVASVTPFSNNATICSYPEFCEENELPADASLSQLDEICKDVNRGVCVEIPTAVGFCMYMRAEAISTVGVLDEKWGIGYGEENDWCLRARDLGWVHLLAADVFVQHKGSVSFGLEVKAAQLKENLTTLTRQYPEYPGDIRRFTQADPPRLARNRVTVERMCKQLRRDFDGIVLFVTHGLGGGIRVNCESLAEGLAKDRIAAVQLGSKGAEWWLGFDEFQACYRAEDFDSLLVDLQRLLPRFVHFHSDIGFDERIWSLPKALACPYYFTVHDYLPVCPRVNMMNAAHTYCGGPTNTLVCNACIQASGAYVLLEERFEELGSDTGKWRAHYGELLAGAKQVFVPDDDVKQRMLRFYPKLVTRSLPHPTRTGMERTRLLQVGQAEPLRVAVIGAIGDHKGYDLLLKCANDALLRQLPLSFHVFGHTRDDRTLLKNPNVHSSGRYEPDELGKLLAKAGCQVALFLSRWPETYSYTLTEALECGLTPVVLNIGAPARRLVELGVGKVLPLSSGATEVNDALTSLRPISAKEVSLKEGRYASILKDYYRSDVSRG